MKLSNSPWCVSCHIRCYHHANMKDGVWRWCCRSCRVTFLGSHRAKHKPLLKLEQAVGLFRQGYSARQVSRSLQMTIATALRYRNLSPTLIVCVCGKPINHHGWCAARISFSPNRQAYLAQCALISAANVSLSAVAREPFLLVWPYVRDVDSADNQLLITVNRFLPRTLPEQVRADVGQELLLAVLSGELSEADIPLHVPFFTRRIWGQQQSRFKELSLESTIGESGRRLEDRLIG